MNGADLAVLVVPFPDGSSNRVEAGTDLEDLMLFAALSNAVCLNNAFFSFFAIDFSKCFFFSCFDLIYWHIVCLFQVLFCIMPSAFNLLVFPNSMFSPFFLVKVLCAFWSC